MSFERKMKRKFIKEVVGKCMKCQYAYTDIKKARCDECQADPDYYPHFKRRKK